MVSAADLKSIDKKVRDGLQFVQQFRWEENSGVKYASKWNSDVPFGGYEHFRNSCWAAKTEVESFGTISTDRGSY